MDFQALREAIERIVRRSRGEKPGVARDAVMVLQHLADMQPQCSVSVAYWMAVRSVDGTG